jgi:hypothetical protein
MKLIQALASLPPEDALPPLASQAFRPVADYSQVTAVVAGYQLWDRIAANPALAMQALRSTNVEVADRAEWVLVKAGTSVLPQLRQALPSSDPASRARIIRILGWQGDREALPLLRKLQESDPQNKVLLAWAIEKIEVLHFSHGQIDKFSPAACVPQLPSAPARAAGAASTAGNEGEASVPETLQKETSSSSIEDPLLCNVELPLRAVFYPLGFAFEIVTNSQAVLDAAGESWRHCPTTGFRSGIATPYRRDSPCLWKLSARSGSPRPTAFDLAGRGCAKPCDLRSQRRFRIRLAHRGRAYKTAAMPATTSLRRLLSSSSPLPMRRPYTLPA